MINGHLGKLKYQTIAIIRNCLCVRIGTCDMNLLNVMQKWERNLQFEGLIQFFYFDSISAENSTEQAVDDGVLEFLLQADVPEVFYDLRRNNGRPNDTSLDQFWNA